MEGEKVMEYYMIFIFNLFFIFYSKTDIYNQIILNLNLR